METKSQTSATESDKLLGSRINQMLRRTQALETSITEQNATIAKTMAEMLETIRLLSLSGANQPSTMAQSIPINTNELGQNLSSGTHLNHDGVRFSGDKLKEWLFLKGRFDDVCDDPIAELKKLRETDGIEDYHNKFDVIRTRLNFTEADLLRYYLAGLRLDTQMNIRMFHPQTVGQCLMLGRLYETAHPQKPTPSSSLECDGGVTNDKELKEPVDDKEEQKFQDVEANVKRGTNSFLGAGKNSPIEPLVSALVVTDMTRVEESNPEKTSVPQQESHQLDTFLFPQMQVMNGKPKKFQGCDRLKSNKTPYLEHEQEDELEQKEAMELISSWNNRVWKPGGIDDGILKTGKTFSLGETYGSKLNQRLLHMSLQRVMRSDWHARMVLEFMLFVFSRICAGFKVHGLGIEANLGSKYLGRRSHLRTLSGSVEFPSVQAQKMAESAIRISELQIQVVTVVKRQAATKIIKLLHEMYSGCDQNAGSELDKKRLRSLKMKMQSHIDLFSSNGWNSSLREKKMSKTWWFKYKENTMARDSQRIRYLNVVRWFEELLGQFSMLGNSWVTNFQNICDGKRSHCVASVLTLTNETGIDEKQRLESGRANHVGKPGRLICVHTQLIWLERLTNVENRIDEFVFSGSATGVLNSLQRSLNRS